MWCNGSYEASQMFCFVSQCNQNKTFEKPKKGVVIGFEILGYSYSLVWMSNLKFKYWLNSIDQWITGSMSNLRNPSWWFLRWKGLTRLTVSAMTPPALQKTYGLKSLLDEEFSWNSDWLQTCLIKFW